MTTPNFPNTLCDAFIDSAVARGFPRNPDHNGERQEGARPVAQLLQGLGLLLGARAPGEAAAFGLAAAVDPAIAEAIELVVNTRHLGRDSRRVAALGVLLEVFLRGQPRLPGIIHQEAEILLNVARSPVNAEQPLAAALLRIPGHLFIDMHKRLRLPLVAIEFQPGNRPALAIRRQRPIDFVHPRARPDMIERGENNLLGQELVQAVIVFSRKQALVPAPAGDDELRRVAALAQGAQRQLRELLQPRPLPGARRFARRGFLEERALARRSLD
ncbi:MAG: hypothetical protein WCJ30_14385, partial [Deltaproteobacteria bacterium]